MTLRPFLLACTALVLLAACTKRDASLASSAPEPAATASSAADAGAASSTPANASSASSNLTYSPATGEMKDRSWAGQVNEAKAVASATAKAAQDRADKAEAAVKEVESGK